MAFQYSSLWQGSHGNVHSPSHCRLRTDFQLTPTGCPIVAIVIFMITYLPSTATHPRRCHIWSSTPASMELMYWTSSNQFPCLTAQQPDCQQSSITNSSHQNSNGDVENVSFKLRSIPRKYTSGCKLSNSNKWRQELFIVGSV